MNIVLVVADPAVLTADDTWTRNYLSDAPPNGLGHTVTVVDDSAAVPSLTGVSLIVFAFSATYSALTTKYDNVTVGILSLRAVPHTNFSSSTAFSNGASQTDLYVSASGPIVDPLTVGTHTVTTVAAAYTHQDSGVVTFGSGAVHTMAASSSLTTRRVLTRYDSGATLNGGGSAPSRRVRLGLPPGFANLNATGKGLIDRAVTWTSALAANLAPTARAGADQTVGPGASVTLNGSASSDPEGPIASFAWTQLSGTAVTLTGANTVQATFTAPATVDEHTLTFRLTVTDAGGLTATDDVSVFVGALRHAVVRRSGAWVRKRRRIRRSGAWV